MRMLLVQSNATNAHKTCSAFTAECDAQVQVCATGGEALELVGIYEYDIVLLGWQPTDMDGLILLKRIRRAKLSLPVVVLSGSARSDIIMQALRLGADDVVGSHTDDAELVARVQAIVRRSWGHSQPAMQVGEIRLDPTSHHVSVAGRPVHLTGKEFSMLELLIRRKGRVLSKDVFLNHLYDGRGDPDAKIIDVFICKLRRKLAVAGAPDAISTVWGRGYTLRDPVAAEAYSGDGAYALLNVSAAAQLGASVEPIAT